MSTERVDSLLRHNRARELAERVVALEDEAERLERELARVRAGLGIDSLAKPREGE